MSQCSGVQAAQAKTMSGTTPLKQSATFYLQCKVKKDPIFKKLKIRQAVSMAINRQETIKKVCKVSSMSANNESPQGLLSKNGQDFSKAATKAESSLVK